MRICTRCRDCLEGRESVATFPTLGGSTRWSRVSDQNRNCGTAPAKAVAFDSATSRLQAQDLAVLFQGRSFMRIQDGLILYSFPFASAPIFSRISFARTSVGLSTPAVAHRPLAARRIEAATRPLTSQRSPVASESSVEAWSAADRLQTSEDLRRLNPFWCPSFYFSAACRRAVLAFHDF